MLGGSGQTTAVIYEFFAPAFAEVDTVPFWQISTGYATAYPGSLTALAGSRNAREHNIPEGSDKWESSVH